MKGYTVIKRSFFVIFIFFSLNILFFWFLHLHINFNHLSKASQKGKNTQLSAKKVQTKEEKTLLQKPWPVLPSFSSWTQNPNLPVGSCEAYFGNGFTHRVDLLPSSSALPQARGFGDGWFRCSYSKTLESSICQGGRLKMNADKITMSKGGESLNSVMGRSEEDEMPQFAPGAFEIDLSKTSHGSGQLVSDDLLNRFMPSGGIEHHPMRELISSIRAIDEDFQCDQWIKEPVLLVTRFEYANLFHTVTDWYSAYASSRVTSLKRRPHVIFVDGHCKAPLEETWEALFSSVRYAKHFRGSVCFEHAVFAPIGYETALFKGLSHSIECSGVTLQELLKDIDSHSTARLSEFGEMVRASFGLRVEGMPKLTDGHNILFIRREDYLAHPRHGGKVESRLANEQEVVSSLKTWISNYSKCKVNLINGLFAHMPMTEQYRAIGDASVIIGAHGAGLTHIIAASPNAVVLEIISSQFRRPHFKLISQWRGLKYHAINLSGSTAEPSEVIHNVDSILSQLGC